MVLRSTVMERKATLQSPENVLAYDRTFQPWSGLDRFLLGMRSKTQSGNRSCSTRHHLRRHQSRLGADGHGRTARHHNPGRERDDVETFDRDLGTSTVRQILQLQRSRVCVVGGNEEAK